MAAPRTSVRDTIAPELLGACRDRIEACRALGVAALRALPFTTMPGGYHRHVVSRAGGMEVTVIAWPVGSEAPLHGHCGSTAVLHVLSGRLREDRYVRRERGFAFEQHLLVSGGESTLCDATLHRVTALEETIAIHVYAPPPADPTESVDAHALRAVCSAWREAHVESDALPAYLHAAIERAGPASRSRRG